MTPDAYVCHTCGRRYVVASLARWCEDCHEREGET